MSEAAGLEELALAYQGGDADALFRIHEALDDVVGQVVARALRRLPGSSALTLPDLRQDVWLALAEAAAAWRPEGGEPFRLVAIRTMRRHVMRTVRACRPLPPHLAGVRVSEAESEQAADPDVRVDPARWYEAALARGLVAALPVAEGQALLRHALRERSDRPLCAQLGVSRTEAARLLRRARLRALALAGELPPDDTWEGELFRLIRAGAHPVTGELPPAAWLRTHTGLGRRRVRGLLHQLWQLGYVEYRGRRWRLARPTLAEVG